MTDRKAVHRIATNLRDAGYIVACRWLASHVYQEGLPLVRPENTVQAVRVRPVADGTEGRPGTLCAVLVQDGEEVEVICNEHNIRHPRPTLPRGRQPKHNEAMRTKSVRLPETWIQQLEQEGEFSAILRRLVANHLNLED